MLQQRVIDSSFPICSHCRWRQKKYRICSAAFRTLRFPSGVCIVSHAWWAPAGASSQIRGAGGSGNSRAGSARHDKRDWLWPYRGVSGSTAASESSVRSDLGPGCDTGAGDGYRVPGRDGGLSDPLAQATVTYLATGLARCDHCAAVSDRANHRRIARLASAHRVVIGGVGPNDLSVDGPGGHDCGLLAWICHPFYTLLNDRIVRAPTFLEATLPLGHVLVLRREGDNRVLRMLRYTARCPICDGEITIEKGRRQHRGRLVGECARNPVEHVFSFDFIICNGSRI